MPEVVAGKRGRALVVGAGFIGLRMASVLAERGWSVQVLTRTVTPELRAAVEGAGVSLVQGDASDAAAISDPVAMSDLVVYCAGGLLPAESNGDPLLDVSMSLRPLLTVLEAIRRTPDTRLTFLSSGGTVYGAPEHLPVAEDHPLDPITSYGVLKVAAEKYIGMYARLYDIEADILRCANVYGASQPGDRSQGVIAAFLERLLRQEPLRIYGDGGVIRDYVHVDDVADVVDKCALRSNRNGLGLFNVGTGVGASLQDIASLLSGACGVPVVFERLAARDFDIPAIVLDVRALSAAIEFRPRSLEVGLREVVGARLGAAAKGQSLSPLSV